MRRPLSILWPALLAQALLAGCLRQEGLRIGEEWHRLLLNGQPAGFQHEVRLAGAGGNITTRSRQKLVVSRGEQKVEMEVLQEVEETPGGALVRFRMVQSMAEDDLLSEGVVQGDRMELTSGGAGESRRSSVPFDPRAVGPQRLRRVLAEKLLRPGDSWTAVTFFPEKGACGSLTAVRGEEELVEFPEGLRKLARRTSRAEILPGVDLHEWVDGSGEVWKTSTSLMGMSITTYRSSAREVLKEKHVSPPEVFYSSSVRPDRPLQGDPRALDEVLYRFSLKEGEFSSRGIEGMFRGAGQTVVREEGPAARVVRIARVRPGRAVLRPVPPPEGMEDSLAPTSLIQSDDRLVAELAAQAVGGESDAWEAARRIERWVRERVRFKDLKTPFASAHEVARKLEGDCTEHGVLLAAMARAAGIPARVVSGLVYQDGAFMGHLWTEVYIDRWIPLDGTRGHGGVGPGHVALSASTLSSSTTADLFLEMAQVMGNLRIEVLEEK